MIGAGASYYWLFSPRQLFFRIMDARFIFLEAAVSDKWSIVGSCSSEQLPRRAFTSKSARFTFPDPPGHNHNHEDHFSQANVVLAFPLIPVIRQRSEWSRVKCLQTMPRQGTLEGLSREQRQARHGSARKAHRILRARWRDSARPSYRLL